MIGGAKGGSGAEPRWLTESWVDDLLDGQGDDVTSVGVVISYERQLFAPGEGSQPYLGPRHRGGAGDMMMDGVSPAPRETRRAGRDVRQQRRRRDRARARS